MTDDDVAETSSETAMAAAKCVATFAENADECRMLLDMLGLEVPTPALTVVDGRLVDNAKAAKHLKFLLDHKDVTWSHIVRATGLSVNTLKAMARPGSTSQASSVKKVLVVTVRDCQPEMIVCECGDEFAAPANGSTKCRECWLGRILADKSRDRVNQLREFMTLVEISTATGLNPSTLSSISNTAVIQRRTTPEVEAAILAVPLLLEVA